MVDVKKKSTRRAFFLSGGGAVLGAGVAATAAAAGLGLPAAGGAAETATGARGSAEDREAIRRLHLSFVARLENQDAAAAADLFDEPVQLGAYRQTISQQKDDVTFSADGLQATARFHCEVELCTPLQDDCTAAQMARMQGLMASRRWESGRFEASYVKARGQWQMTAVSYVRA